MSTAAAAAPTQPELLMAVGLPSTTTTTTSQQPAARAEKPERNLWREQEMLTVLQIIRDHNYLALLNDKTVRSETVFRNIEKEMNDRGLRKKNFQQIWTKWKFLKSTYMTSRRMHQIPKIIPLDVYESLDELLGAEFRTDGSVSSYDGVDYDDGYDGGAPAGVGGGNSSYEMMNASASTGSNDGLLVISNVQGGVAYNGAKNFTNFSNGTVRRKFTKNGLRATFKNEEETNGFGMQHPIFGFRLGVVKDEPIDDEYEGNTNPEDAYSDVQLDEAALSQQYPDIKSEKFSPRNSPLLATEDEELPPVPVMQMPTLQSMPPASMSPNVLPLIDPLPPLRRYTPPPFVHVSSQPPPLKQMPLVKIALPPKPLVSSPDSPLKRPPPPAPITANSKKIPVLTIRKRKKRLNIPQLSEGTNSPAPSSKHSKISEEEDTKESSAEPLRIPFVTYGKAMREMSVSLREIQREMIDEFFKQQMDLAKSEHEFQKQQDAMLLRCFEDQTKMLLEGAKRMFTANFPDVVHVSDE